jgi:DNA-binding IclR family transcriptional regulator
MAISERASNALSGAVQRQEDQGMAPRTSGTVVKALDILDLFENAEDGLTVTAIAEKTGINISTVVRLCATLEGRAYLRRDRHGVYLLGVQIDKLSRIYRHQFDAEALLRPALARLRDQTGESASFYVIDGDVRICLFRENSQQPIRHVVEEGARLPLKDGVVGRVLLAFSGRKGAEFRTIREAGHLIDEGREAFTASVSVPVLSGNNTLAGALVVSGLASRFTEKDRAQALTNLKEVALDVGPLLPDQVHMQRA